MKKERSLEGKMNLLMVIFAVISLGLLLAVFLTPQPPPQPPHSPHHSPLHSPHHSPHHSHHSPHHSRLHNFHNHSRPWCQQRGLRRGEEGDSGGEGGLNSFCWRKPWLLCLAWL